MVEPGGSVDVGIQRLPHAADLDLPAYQTVGAAGMDLRAALSAPLRLAPGAIARIPCGFAMALPEGWEAQIRPRSGLATRHGVTVVNAPGTVDADYRGEVQVGLINLGAEPFTVERGMRVAQMLLQPVHRAHWVEWDALPASERGAGGFGHTGR